MVKEAFKNFKNLPKDETTHGEAIVTDSDQSTRQNLKKKI